MGHVRPLVEDDIPQVADLFLRVFGTRPDSAAVALRADLLEIFCRNPWRDQGSPSLVYEETDGRIVGCLGVIPRPMSMNGRPIHSVVSHTFMVDPGERRSSAAVQLLKAFLSGPQDLSIAQSSEVSRRIMEGCGGSTALLYSLGWTRLLRPSRYLLALCRKAGLTGSLATVLAPFCSTTDALVSRALPKRFRLSTPRLVGGELDHDTLRGCLSELTRDRSLRPEYDAGALTWLLDRLDRRQDLGTLRKVLVRTASGDIAGWYLYYPRPGTVSEVVQMAARPGTAGEVLDHLLSDAWRHRATAVSGQLDPAWMQVLATRYCLFNRGDGSWFLVHSKDQELLQAIFRGDAFLTRLEGEWWIRF